MPTPIETTLTTLLPTYTPHTLPPALLSLSTSLLAQSRAKAATLKPEEEIARTYACCHIACQRLGHKLALEIAKPAPPVNPKVYNKLHTYFNTVLATPRKGRVDRVGEDGGKGVRVNGVKAKREVEREQVTPVKNTAAASLSTGKRKASAISGADVELPAFAKSLIRYLSERFATPGAIPHTFAGVQTALREQAWEEDNNRAKKPRTPTSNTTTTNTNHNQIRLTDKTYPALIVTIYVAVAEKLYGADFEPRLRVDAVQFAEEFCELNFNKLPFRLEEQRRIEEEVTQLRNHDLKEWMKLGWWDNVPSPSNANGNETGNGDGDGDGEVNIQTQIDDQLSHNHSKKTPSKTPLRRKEKHASRPKDGDEVVGAAGLLPGLGTMFQPSIDWLSEERRAEYAVWKMGLLREAEVAKAKPKRVRVTY